MKVVQLYRGDFMAGLETGEAEYDAWLNAERTRCLNAAVHVIDRLLRMLIDGRHHEEALHYAHRLAECDPNAVATLLFEAAVERERTGVRAADPPELAQLEAVIARDTDNLEALLGLSRSLILRAALHLSKGLNRLDDLWRAAWRLAQAEPLAQVTPPPPATMSDIAFLGGMLDKLENRFPEAAEKFGKALALAQGNSSAAAELAHRCC